VSHELCKQYHVDLPLKMPYDHANRRYELAIVIVRIAENSFLNCAALRAINVTSLIC